MREGRGQRAVERFREMEALQELHEKEYQKGLDAMDDTQEFEREIIQFLSKGRRG